MKQSMFRTVILPTIIFAAIIMFASSCKNLVPYTDALKTQHGWSIEQVEHIQFILSDEIVLERQLVTDIEDHISGKVVSRNGQRYEEVYFKKGLKIGLIGITDNGNYIMRCDIKEGHTLTFGVNPNKGGKFVLLASDWVDKKGKVHYNGIEYFTTNSSVHLLIDLRRKIDYEDDYKKARGFKVK
jgi:hypothetical protein